PAGILETAFDSGTRTGSSYFLFGLLFQHGLAWCFLATSALIVRHSWRDQGVTPTPAETPGESWNRARDDHQWRDGPLAWYAWRNSWARRGTWWLAGGALAVALLAYLVLEFAGQRTLAQGTAAGLLTAGFYLLKLLLAVHVVYFLQDACRTGAMELLLATPISSQALCAGHLAALRRLFTRPFLMLAVASISLAVLERLLDGGDWPSVGIRFLTAGVPALFSVVLHGLDLVAVAYHASRWALFYDRPAKALLRTTLLLLLLPALFCSVGRLFVDLFVILQSRPLLERFRDLVRGWYFPGFLGTGYGAPRTG
ncbi:MAG: hypothetical protein IT580_00475, partial [Verrucomicrobiales bacterium]|nr:hypothetical protein [Verrucomicrobiales bacterium]